MQRTVKRPTSKGVFELTSNAVSKVLKEDLINEFEILDVEETLLANCYVTKQNIAHIVYYPGANIDGAEKDIPLHKILEVVKDSIKDEEDLKNLTIKKYITVSVYNKTGIGENHYVAITEINNQLTVVNPKQKHIARFSNPDMKYLKDNLPDLADKPLAADRQNMFDKTSSGYAVAAIHASAASNTINNFKESMQNIDIANLYIYNEVKTPKIDLARFISGRHIFGGIMIALGITLVLALILLTIVLTHGAAGIAIGGALTMAATYIGSGLALTGIAAHVMGAIMIGLGLGSAAMMIGSIMGSIAGWLFPRKPAKVTTLDDLDVSKESQTVIREGISLVIDDESLQKGNECYEQENYGQAIIHYQKAIKANSGQAKTWQYCGDAYYELGKYPQAISCYREAMKINPEYMLAYRHTGEAYYKQERYNEAVVFFGQAIKWDKKSFLNYKLCGDAYFKLGEYFFAIEHYNQAFALDPKNHELLAKLGMAEELLGREKAAAKYKACVKLKPDDKFANEKLIKLEADQEVDKKIMSCGK